ncbi:uncharacterized protein LY89DRAFT_621013 [Mollisia scopiformis]|uniref:DNA-directed RNA polymerase III subunit n=1 Tax=Mollisia scopiformis TaxID=149040 RepID=A0A194X3B2_MOLSC|nr:uncharacterized protein LY89DRAFT_621013 [Mollisia scopiformis]KUJ14509.1 hypothetical protein LY89DRAFT_621013 [Mollisia scopiformis]
MAGRGRGRGGAGAGAGAGQLKGATWEYDASIQLESKPADLFPKHPNLRKPAPITTKERREIDNFKKLQDQIHRGPLYTQPTKRDPNAPAKTFGEEQFNKQFGTNSKANMDPFHGVETYSMRYAPKQRTLPKLSDQPFNKTLFPEELWSTLEGEEGQEVRNHLNRAMERKEAMLASMKAAENGAGSGAGNGADNGADKGAGADASAKTKILLEKIHKVAGDEDNEELEEEQDAEDVDDAYEDEDLGEDYNAEGYFDDGEDDQEDEADGGDENY